MPGEGRGHEHDGREAIDVVIHDLAREHDDADELGGEAQMRLIGQRVEAGRIGLLDRVRTEGDRLAEMPAGEPGGFGGRDHFVRARRIGHPPLCNRRPVLAEVHTADTAELRHVVVVECGGEGLPVGSERNHEEVRSIGDMLHVREACELPAQLGGTKLIRDARGLELEIRGLCCR